MRAKADRRYGVAAHVTAREKVGKEPAAYAFAREPRIADLLKAANDTTVPTTNLRSRDKRCHSEIGLGHFHWVWQFSRADCSTLETRI